MKNPIAVAFGNFLRETRNEFTIPLDELVDEIGINISYYRLLESGTNVIHISKTLDLINAFNHYNANLSYEGVSTIIMGIYFTQPLIKLAEKKDGGFISKQESLLDNLRIYDKKLYVIINAFSELNLFKDTEISSKEIIRKLKEKEVDGLVYQFINNYYDFGETSLNIQNSLLHKKIISLPTIYFEFVIDTVNNLFYLPNIMGSETIWQWEQKNKIFFKEIICLTTDLKSIVSKENLENYQYKYLWEDNFERFRMIIIDNQKDKGFLEREFKKILKKELIKKDKLPYSFNVGVDKMNFGVIKKSYKKNIIHDLLSGMSINDNSEKNKNDLYDAIIIYTLVKNNGEEINVAMLADINYEDKKRMYILENGVSLNYVDMKKKFEVLTDIWNEIYKEHEV